MPSTTRRPCWLQVDAVPRPDRKHLLPLAERLRQLRQFEDVFFISAKKGRRHTPELGAHNPRLRLAVCHGPLPFPQGGDSSFRQDGHPDSQRQSFVPAATSHVMAWPLLPVAGMEALKASSFTHGWAHICAAA